MLSNGIICYFKLYIIMNQEIVCFLEMNNQNDPLMRVS